MLRWLCHRAASAAIIISLLIVIANFLYVGPPGALPQPAVTLSNHQLRQVTAKQADNPEPKIFSLEWFTHDSVGFFTAVLSALSGLLVIISTIQIKYLIRADRLARQSLIASNRAWVRRERDGIRFATALRFLQGGGADSSIGFTVKNVGNAPALHVNLHAWLLPVIGRIPEAEARAHFASLRQTSPSGGFTLFPNDTYPSVVNVAVYPSVQLTQAQVNAATGADPAANMSLYVACCIDYTFASDVFTHHQTSFILDVETPAGGPIRPNIGIIAADDLTLRDTPFGFDRAD
jgi:hypothetical protein